VHRQQDLAADGGLEDLQLALDDDEGPVPGVALGEQEFTGGYPHLFDAHAEPLEVVGVEVGEERDFPQHVERAHAVSR
jgi:hypothetical protein